MTETILFNAANVASENGNVEIATSNEQIKKTRKMKKLNESFEKRIMKNGEFRTDKFKLDEVAKIIELAEKLKKAIEESNSNKNVNKIVALAQKLNVSNSEIDNVVEKLLAMKTAA
jgi:predicted nucleotidyltransferase